MSITTFGFPGLLSTLVQNVIQAIAQGYTKAANGLFPKGTSASNGLKSVASSDSMLLVLDAKGRIARSNDGVNFVEYDTLTGLSTGKCITYGDGVWYATGNTTGEIVFSTDGLNWTQSTLLSSTIGSDVIINNVLYNAIKNVVIIAAGVGVFSYNKTTGLFNSTDNLSTAGWGSNKSVNAIAINPTNGDIVISGAAGLMATSSDGGITWTNRPTLVSSATELSFNNDGTVLIATTGSTSILRCNDTVEYSSWSTVSIGTTITKVGHHFDGVDGYWYISGTTASNFRRSVDGITWVFDGTLNSSTWGTTANIVNMISVRHGGINSLYITGEYTRLCRVTENTGSWANMLLVARATWGSNTPCKGIIKSNNTYFAINGDGVLASSTDGVNWTCRLSLNEWRTLAVIPSSTNNTVMVSNGTTLLIGIGTNWVSVDISTWTISYVYAAAYSMGAAVWTGSRFVVGTSNGTFLYSTNGISWTTATQPSGWTTGAAQAVTAMGWNGSVILAVGLNRMCSTSTNGGTWTSVSTSFSNTWGGAGRPYTAIWTGTYWFVGAASGGALRSVNGSTWTVANALYYGGWGPSPIYCGVMSGNRLYAGGDSNRLYYSTDSGTTWSAVNINGTTWGTNQLLMMVDTLDNGIIFGGSINNLTNDFIGHYKP